MATYSIFNSIFMRKDFWKAKSEADAIYADQFVALNADLLFNEMLGDACYAYGR